VGKRTRRPGPASTEPRQETRPSWPAEGHSGEGSASALETLQKLEIRRVAARAVDPGPEEDPPKQE
jgi:hypothetical protein